MFNHLLKINTILLIILLPYGSFVRLTKSGLACPDWPLCYGKFVPSLNVNIFYEISHRYLAIIVGIIAIVLVCMTLFNKHLAKYKAISILVLALIIIQGILGGLTVIFGLNPISVVSHLVVGNICLWLMIGFLVKYKNKTFRLFSRNKSIIIITGLYFLVLILGGINSSTLSGYICPYFPFCTENAPGIGVIDNRLLILNPDTWKLFYYDLQQWAQLLHRFVAICLWIISIYFIFKIKINNFDIKKWQYNMLPFLVTIQLILGITNSLLKLPIFISLFHSIFATLITANISYLWYKSK